MNWPIKFLTKFDQEKVAAAIAKAEKKTSVEIVPVVVRKSSSTSHVFLFLMLFVFSLTLIFEAWLGPLAAGFSFIVSLGLTFFLNQFDWVHRCLTPVNELNLQVSQRAELEFWRQKLHQTQGRTGVLIFLSLFERKVIVLGDEAIQKYFEEKDWTEAVEILLKHIKDGDPAEGFIQAINKILTVVKDEFPPSKRNKNELSDGIIFKD